MNLIGLQPESGFAMDLFVRSSLLLALAWALHAALARFNPRWRIFLWRAVGCGLVLIPALMMLIPKYEVPIEMPMQLEPAPAGTSIISAVTGIDQSNVTVLEQIQLPVADQAVAAPAVPMFDARELLLAGWTLITGAFLLLYARKYFALRGVLAASTVAPPLMQRALRKLAADFECETPRLLLSPVIPAPILVGIRRPAIIIPERIAEELTETGLAGILAHELSHLSSRDLMWTRILQILSTLLWFHPLVWRLRRAHDFACELVCDRTASEYSGGADQYSRTLADVALAMAGQWRPNFGLAMARRPDILTRLDSLNRALKALPLARGRKAAAIAMIMVLMGCITSVDLKPASTEKPKPVAQAGTEASEPPMAAMAVPAGVPMVAMRRADDSSAPDANPNPPMPAMAVPAGVPMVAMQRADVPSSDSESSAPAMAAMAVSAGVPMMAMQRAEDANSEPPMPAMAVPAGVPMVAMQRADDASTASANSESPMAAMATRQLVQMARGAVPSQGGTANAPMAAMAAPPAGAPMVMAARVPVAMRVAAPPQGWTAGATDNRRLIGLEIVPFTVNDTRAREFSASVSPTTKTLGRVYKGSLGVNDINELVQMALHSRHRGNRRIQGNNIDWALRLLEAEGIINLARPISLNVREGVAANIGYVGGGFSQSEALQQFNEFTRTNVAWSDFKVAQFGEPTTTCAGTSMLMRVVPHLTTKDDEDAAQLEIKLLSLRAPQSKPEPGMALPPAPLIEKKSAVVSDAIVTDGGSIILGAWTDEQSSTYHGGVPVMRDIPAVGKLFSREVQMRTHYTTMVMIRCRINE
ncbi:M48 family metalloprotease [bacterium]|nr:M48 family metalloprotease [bacterium]